MLIRVVLKNGDMHLVEQDMEQFKETLRLMQDIAFIQDKEGWEFHAREIVKFRQHDLPAKIGETRNV